MLEIKTTGFEDYLDGSANIKALIIGGPGAGKTRWSSFWPKAFFIDCEDGRGSIADRGVPYVRVRSSRDMLDTLEYLKALESTPKANRDVQTVVVDTSDSFQRIVKEEWVTANKAGSFSGFDAWGYLDTKMNLLFTRLLNLDYNVIVLVHYKTKEHKDGDNTVREFALQMQGAIADQVFNDFGLVGWMGTYWEPGEEGRVQKRGLTFQPTPEKPFLKDRFNVTPKWMEVTFSERDYEQLFEAFMRRGDVEAIPEATSLGSVPETEGKNIAGPVAPPTEGGPVAPRASSSTVADVPLDKQTKEQLLVVARDLGIAVRGNSLKSEIIEAIQAAKSASGSSNASGQTSVPASTASAATSAPDEASPAPAWVADRKPSSMTEGSSTPLGSSDPSWSGDAEKSAAAPPAAESGSDAVGLVADVLGGEVIAEVKADAPVTQEAAPPTEVTQPDAAPLGPSECANCGADLTPAWADPALKNALRLSYVKFRQYLCGDCVEKLGR